MYEEFVVTDKQRSCYWANQNTGRRRYNYLLTCYGPTACRTGQWTRSLMASNCQSLPATWTYSSWNEPAYQGFRVTACCL